MSHRDGRVTLSAWVDPVVREYARLEADAAGVEFSRWIERVVQKACAEASVARAIRDAEVRELIREREKAPRGPCTCGRVEAGLACPDSCGRKRARAR